MFSLSLCGLLQPRVPEKTLEKAQNSMCRSPEVAQTVE
jgi:hypothetical protein